MAQQGEDAVTDQVGGGLVAGDQEEAQQVQHFAFAQAFAVLRPPTLCGSRYVVNGPGRVKSPSRGSLIRQHRGLSMVAGSRWRRRSVGASVVSVA